MGYLNFAKTDSVFFTGRGVSQSWYLSVTSSLDKRMTGGVYLWANGQYC